MQAALVRYRRRRARADGGSRPGDRVETVGVSEADRDGFEGKRPSPWNLELRHNGFSERTKTAMGSLAESVREQPAMPRFEDGPANLREPMRRIAEDVANAIMGAEAAFARLNLNTSLSAF